NQSLASLNLAHPCATVQDLVTQRTQGTQRGITQRRRGPYALSLHGRSFGCLLQLFDRSLGFGDQLSGRFNRLGLWRGAVEHVHEGYRRPPRAVVSAVQIDAHGFKILVRRLAWPSWFPAPVLDEPHEVRKVPIHGRFASVDPRQSVSPPQGNEG